MSHTGTADDHSRGRHADTPTQIPAKGWWDILKRTWSESSRDNISIVAAGVAFLSLLAIFPAMSATIAIYGLVADPASIPEHVNSLSGVLPPDGLQVLQGQLQNLASQNSGALSFGLVSSLVLALWSAAGGIKSMMSALNIAYDEEEKRSFLKFTATALTLTLGAIMLLVVTIGIVIAVPAALHFIGLGQVVEWAVRILRWPLLGAALILALAVLYRYGPCRATPKWRWITWGAAAATLLWLAGSIAFSIYISKFADYNATYGSLGAGIILLLWLYLGAYAVLLGAELDAEMEHQTKKDTTTGPEKPMGERSAFVADTVGEAQTK
ncbi:YihY/virulence factor BrkB family protein [Aerophototrophica crusticola]|uniref:YihY/virulence factor BrkB family protein n=1 Tax=Aerophototrophica crusticola TaxID=1709002 RepID=A0A858R6X2_9PROT|nr:YihY/virulence factor BrkB family protein [Rhodospirillaceae bacterium B3]